MRICWNSSRKLWYRTPDAAISYRQTGKYWNSAVLAACMRCRNMRRRTSHNLPPTASRHDEVVHSSRMQSIWVQQIVLVSQLRDNPIKLSICANERVVDVCNVYWLSILDWLFNHANDPMKMLNFVNEWTFCVWNMHWPSTSHLLSTCADNPVKKSMSMVKWTFAVCNMYRLSHSLQKNEPSTQGADLRNWQDFWRGQSVLT